MSQLFQPYHSLSYHFINRSNAHLIQIKNDRTMKRTGIERQHYFVHRAQTKQ